MEKAPVKIVITGPESTGKTELAKHLAGVCGAEYMPEYARGYVERLGRPYTYEDVEHIARVQEQQLSEAVSRGDRIIIMDTYLVITKIWFREVYGRLPDWIDQSLDRSAIDLFLLCYYDLDWISDPVRENPGARRKVLFEKYREEISMLGIPCAIVNGIGPERFTNARNAVKRHFPHIQTKK